MAATVSPDRRVLSSIFGGGSSIEWDDAILRFETRPNDNGTIDEVLIYVGDRCVFHLEQLDDDAYWFAWYGDGMDRDQHFDIRRHGKRVTITGPR
ncbi:MAG TPA: hypothetical protein DIT48_00595 [Actinobacteria bacterium]|nr:hypothetical protein [Actinomycetota bacterium]